MTTAPFNLPMGCSYEDVEGRPDDDEESTADDSSEPLDDEDETRVVISP